ncbi:lysine--tRNA ligase [Candidatus Moduliflexota bacterium]
MEQESDQVQQRLRKLGELREMGVDPYPARYAPTDSAAALHEEGKNLSGEQLTSLGRRVRVAGRIVALRRFGKAAFTHIQDGSGRIQLYLKKDLLSAEDFAVFKKLDIGDLIGVDGVLFRTKTEELTVEASSLTLLSKSLRPLPEKWHGLKDIEQRYRQRYLDLIVNPDVRDVFRTRARLVAAIREFFNARGFLEVETPMMQPIPGGATAKPFRTFYNALDTEVFLRVAPELYLKRLIIGGFDRVFEINRNFRNEGLSREHNPEFTMLEFYQTFADYESLMSLTEELFVGLARDISGSEKIVYQGQEVDFTPPWRRLPLVESLTTVGGLGSDEIRDPSFLESKAKELGIPLDQGYGTERLQVEIWERLVEPTLVDPTFVTDFPKAVSPLAKCRPDDPGTVERFELFIAGKEVANAFTELNDPVDQRERFGLQVAEREAGDDEAQRMDEDFLRALEHGMPPAGGEGIGIDRLVMLFTDSANIRDVILFPQLRPEKSGDE